LNPASIEFLETFESRARFFLTEAGLRLSLLRLLGLLAIAFLALVFLFDILSAFLFLLRLFDFLLLVVRILGVGVPLTIKLLERSLMRRFLLLLFLSLLLIFGALFLFSILLLRFNSISSLVSTNLPLQVTLGFAIFILKVVLFVLLAIESLERI
jgi:hypothetical protein